MSRMPLFCLLVVIAVLTGCPSSSQPAGIVIPAEQLEAMKQKFASSVEPDASLGVIELRESFPDDETEATEEVTMDPADETAPVNPIDYEHVVVVGKVGGKCPEGIDASNFPIVQNAAVFHIVDPAIEADEGHDHGDDHDCPFCNQRAANAQAIVRLLGDDGQPLPICVKALFELEPGALVVVSGSAAVELDTLVITAEKVFVR